VYSNPRARESEKNYWGEAQAYLNESRLIIEGRARHHRDPNYEDDLRLLARYRPTGKLLDVGTNLGMFLRLARNRGWELHGVEPSPALSEIARSAFGLRITTGYLEHAGFEDESFDVITMTDVLEHVTTPYAFLAETHRILSRGGVLLVKVPNVKWSEFKLKLDRRLGRVTTNDIFDAYEHVVHYDEKTLRRTLERVGFRVRHLDIARPVQLPVWHEYVGQYYQYPSPWILDPKRHLGRNLFYLLAQLQRTLTGSIGPLAPNLRAVATR
jgi:2-polyprenyl-3-methyl-5-hydroxy-6-metoxy-1,4-benzoquinol methylase